MDGPLLRYQNLKALHMKILIVQESDWIGRGPHQQHQLADRLSLRGHQVRVIDYEILWPEAKNMASTPAAASSTMYGRLTLVQK
jgi:hypothetical protein